MASALFLFAILVKLCFSSDIRDNSFARIRNKPTFVDKTPLIYEFLKHKYLFINAPSKFGKSTNLDMIGLFLSSHRPKKVIENQFIWTKIWESEEFVRNNLGQYPVIHFNLKIRGYSSNYEHTVTSFKVSLYNAFIEHAYLLESEKLGEDQIKMLEIYTDLTNIKLLDTDTVANGLAFLADVLHQHHGKQVILLADEFGRGITEGILKNHLDLSLVVELYSSILNTTFHNSTVISHALLCGESWIYGLKGPAVSLIERVSFMQRIEFSRFYGFTYDEVDQLMAKFNTSKEEKVEGLKWYGGYSSYDGLFKVCNPFSIIEYLSHKSTMVFWTGSALAPDLVRRMLEVDNLKRLILDLVTKKTVNMNLEKDTKIVEVEFIRNKVEELPQYCENFFLQVLIEAGFLTFAENQMQSNNVFLKFPNEEVLSAVVKYTV
uniref:AAA-ATPase-like domain-containing protein n=1 Tax=Homalodisca liturata TaxID=320908 RepID=A0A1B6H963_9HEMI